MPNTDELSATLDVIRKNPQLWDQNSYFNGDAECGATACFDGWTLLRHGHTFDEIKAMPPEDIDRFASHILELSENEHDAICFYMTSNIEDLERRVQEVIDGVWSDDD